MSFDYGKFERNAAIGSLASLGCSRAVLKHAARRYAFALGRPGEYRRALREAGESPKQLKTKVKAARGLSRLLSRLRNNPHITLASKVQPQAIVCWRQVLEEIAQWLNTLPVFRPDAKDAALALTMHVRQKTRQQHLPEIVKLLNAALAAAGLSDNLSAETLRKQVNRANRQRAEEMLRGWELLAPSASLKK